MKIKPAYFYLLVATWLSACTFVSFDRPPAFEKLKQFPIALHGKYKIHDKRINNDSSYLLIDSYKLTWVDPILGGSLGLSDTVVLLKHGGKYLLNIQINEIEKNGKWWIIPMQYKKECLTLYSLHLKEYHKYLNENFEADTMFNRSYFMNDEAFSQLLQKQLRRKSATYFKK